MSERILRHIIMLIYTDVTIFKEWKHDLFSKTEQEAVAVRSQVCTKYKDLTVQDFNSKRYPTSHEGRRNQW